MPKRGENIRKRKDGRWEARIKTASGKSRSVYAKSYGELKVKLQDTKEEKHILLIENTEAKKDFSYVCKQWLKLSEIRNKKSTVARYREIINNHLLPFFSNTEISTESVNTFILYKINNEKLQPKTVYDILSVFVQILKYAKANSLLDINNFDISRPTLNKKELQVLTEEEQKSLVKSIKKNITCENIGIILSLYTGMRLGEICALLWKDIDLKSGTITINKSMQRIATGNKDKKTMIIIDTPKTQNSIRVIPIPDFLIEEFKRLSKYYSPNSYILTADEERFIEPRLYQYKFKKHLKEAKIRDINFHALRHTFATRAIEQDVDVKVASEILGHSTVNFTLERYVHISLEFKKQNMKKLTACY